ncbi:potassium transporter Kup [Bradyrhizobium sp. MOS002]|uniref:potassium transporter Kup n=1 Tax=Bradyrhizobium sp. MOS002 TaxID=2133947 RepID=UPI000D13D39D|nr:KUP/HAK/KT family potassium transporter [Bradyrhizobium sp. MOS002]PSO32537.1 potassium transporter Kup [Bradyrhizobium sp. MOS002]
MAVKTNKASPDHSGHSLSALSLAALGVVYGDIGTSPLYTLKIVLGAAGQHPAPEAVLGSLSLIVWTLIIITTVKYIILALRVDNQGEGGVLALMALLSRKPERHLVLLVGMFGAALVYGDCVLTPAISVLSALEGLEVIAPELDRFVLPGTVAILAALFAVQQRGTAVLGRFLGPVMAAWFAVLALLGLWGIAQYPAVLWALNPSLGLHFLFSGGGNVMLVLGGVFLCVTGAEALYADLGHFGRTPIRLGWCVVFPALVLNYAGQAAIVLAGGPIEGSLFFRLCPAPVLLLPLVIFATVATAVASQAVITGAFSMTRQAIQLGCLPRLRIVQTSAGGFGQIYLPAVNWLLMVATLVLAIGFRTSENLAAAYGIAVSADMVLTTLLLSIALREIWGLPLPAAIAIGLGFATVEGAFLAANMLKFADGGWVPVLFAIVLFTLMRIWQTGSAAVHRLADVPQIPIGDIVAQIESGQIRRVPGTAVFVARITREIPPLLVWHLRHNHALHDSVGILNVVTEMIPYVAEKDRLDVRQIGPQVWRNQAHYGFMEQPDLPALLERARAEGYPVDRSNTTYFIGRETVVRRKDGKGLPWLVEIVFSFMLRNSSEAIDYFQLPRDEVVEIGRQFAI